jgi:hypothetical protein
VPIAFVTGRSDAFVRRRLVEPMLGLGLADALARPGTALLAVCEKGGVRASVTPEGLGDVEIDHAVELPTAYVAAVRDLVGGSYAGEAFFDETKRVMISVEQALGTSREAFRRAQDRLDDDLLDLAREHGIGLAIDDRSAPDASGATPFRIERSIIATDVESERLGKDAAAARAVEHLVAATGRAPAAWRSVGDSRTDYLMSDALHRLGYDVAHVDVRPGDGVPEKPYPVIVRGELIHDAAGADFLRECVSGIR